MIKKTSETQKEEIMMRVLGGSPPALVAKQFGVPKKSVQSMVRHVKDAANTEPTPASLAAPSQDWRGRLTRELPPLAVDAVVDSMKDRTDVHKAAATATAFLRGMGIYQPEQAQSVSVIFANVPDSLAADYEVVPQKRETEPPDLSCLT